MHTPSPTPLTVACRKEDAAHTSIKYFDDTGTYYVTVHYPYSVTSLVIDMGQQLAPLLQRHSFQPEHILQKPEGTE